MIKNNFDLLCNCSKWEYLFDECQICDHLTDQDTSTIFNDAVFFWVGLPYYHCYSKKNLEKNKL